MHFYIVFLSSIGGLIFCSLVFVAIIKSCRNGNSEDIHPEKVRKGLTTYSQKETQYDEEDFLEKVEKPSTPPRRKIKIRVNKLGGFSHHPSSSPTHVALPPLKHTKLETF
jgi:hypothetical protein